MRSSPGLQLGVLTCGIPLVRKWSGRAIVKHEWGNFRVRSSTTHLKPVFRTVFVMGLVFMQLRSCGCGRVSEVRVDFYG